MFRLKLPSWPRKRGSAGLTLLLWTPHPIQRDFEQSLVTVAEKSKRAPMVGVERHIGSIAPGRFRELQQKAAAAEKPLIVQASLMADAKLVRLGKRQVADVDRFLESVEAKKVRVLLLVTPQDRLFEALYVKQVETGSTASFSDHLKQLDEVDLSYGRLIRRLKELPSVQSVEALSWKLGEENLATLLREVFRRVGDMPGDELAQFDRPPKIRGYASRRGVRVARAMHQFIDTAAEHALVRQFVRENFRAKRFPDTEYLSDGDRERLLQKYADDVAMTGRTGSN